jgi:hypothetical protein
MISLRVESPSTRLLSGKKPRNLPDLKWNGGNSVIGPEKTGPSQPAPQAPLRGEIHEPISRNRNKPQISQINTDLNYLEASQNLQLCGATLASYS